MDKSIYDQDYKTFISLIKEYREQKSITQDDVAEYLNTQQTMISKMERGERRIDVLEFWKICKFLEIPVDEFFSKFEERIFNR